MDLSDMYPQFYGKLKVGMKMDYLEKCILIDKLICSGIHFVETRNELDLIRSELLVRCPGGSSLLHLNHGSLQSMFSESYPQLIRDVGYALSDHLYKRTWFEKTIMNNFDIHTKEDFTTIHTAALQQCPGGHSILNHNNASVQSILKDMYPELLVNIHHHHHGYWKDLKNNGLAQKVVQYFSIKKREDWSAVSMEQISKFNETKIRKNNFQQLLKYWYPDEDWNLELFERNTLKRQRFLGLKLAEIFKDEVILENFIFKLPHHKYIVFDFYIPEKQLVIEYQGEQHYFDHVHHWLPFEIQKMRDEEKKRICAQNNLKLIYVPYWWDDTIQDLSSRISQ
eukprot:TRINITY_DN3480_c0_g1_i1.p2 TRINITY_DN3480_c0_g1~~TRINITY_DN3480_c0_g1_i1.p2  ORF type:complete len:338 (-),score=79.38 TRINITY_DN3480_c0_g1_i1:1084-2097(-)